MRIPESVSSRNLCPDCTLNLTADNPPESGFPAADPSQKKFNSGLSPRLNCFVGEGRGHRHRRRTGLREVHAAKYRSEVTNSKRLGEFDAEARVGNWTYHLPTKTGTT